MGAAVAGWHVVGVEIRIDPGVALPTAVGDRRTRVRARDEAATARSADSPSTPFAPTRVVDLSGAAALVRSLLHAATAEPSTVTAAAGSPHGVRAAALLG